MTENMSVLKLIIESRKTNLQKRLERLESKIAETAGDLSHLNGINLSSSYITLGIISSYMKFKDDGYIGGYWPDHSEKFEVAAHTFRNAQLGVLALQSMSLYHIQERYRPSGICPDYYGMELVDARYDNIAFDITSDVRSQFLISLDQTIPELSCFIIKGEQDNQFDDIPIKIGRSDLADALAKRSMLEYCETSDPDFSITRI